MKLNPRGVTKALRAWGSGRRATGDGTRADSSPAAACTLAFQTRTKGHTT